MSQVLHPKALMTLMFGSTAAVYAFNQVSRSLWFLINVYLKVPTAVYCYDYPMFFARDKCPGDRQCGFRLPRPTRMAS